MDNQPGKNSETMENADANKPEEIAAQSAVTGSDGLTQPEKASDKGASVSADEDAEEMSEDLIVPEGETKKERFCRRCKLLLKLFLCYIKIGLFTFGGGYAMIALIENEYVRKRRWITNEEFYEIIAIAESTPGPIAINSATFIGYKLVGFWGALVAVVAVCIPSVAIIYIISLFYDEFMAFTPVQYAFEGIKVGIAILIISAGVGMMKKKRKDVFDWCVFLPAFLLVTLFDIFNIDFSSIYLILIGIAIGIIYKIVVDLINKKKDGPAAEVSAALPTPKSDEDEEDKQ